MTHEILSIVVLVIVCMSSRPFFDSGETRIFLDMEILKLPR